MSIRRGSRVLDSMRAAPVLLLVLAVRPGWADVPDAGAPGSRLLTVQDRVVAEAEKYLGKPYSFGGRDGRPGCIGAKKCRKGVDCLSLIFFAYERVQGKPWASFSVKPSITVKRRELGEPVPGLAGVLAAEVDRALLRKGDVLLFLLEGYNLSADEPLIVRGERKYGAWHTALVYSAEGGKVEIIHAKPGDQVVIEPLEGVAFDGLLALRLPSSS